MYNNKHILNLMVIYGAEHVMKEINSEKIEDNDLKKLFEEYYLIRKKIANYIIDASNPKESDQIELDLK